MCGTTLSFKYYNVFGVNEENQREKNNSWFSLLFTATHKNKHFCDFLMFEGTAVLDCSMAILTLLCDFHSDKLSPVIILSWGRRDAAYYGLRSSVLLTQHISLVCPCMLTCNEEMSNKNLWIPFLRCLAHHFAPIASPYRKTCDGARRTAPQCRNSAHSS